MNKCIFVGRMAADPELRTTAQGTSVCQFRIAVQRTFKNAQGNYDADFISCVAWRQTADFVVKYLHKGDMVAICGALQTRTYQAQDGSTRYVAEIVVDSLQPCGSRKQENNNVPAPQPQPQADGGFTEVDDEELPF